MSHRTKKITRRQKLNLLLIACHGLISQARELGISMNKFRRLFPGKCTTAKRYRHGTPGTHGRNGLLTPASPPPRRSGKHDFPGNAHDRRIQRRQAARPHTP